MDFTTPAPEAQTVSARVRAIARESLRTELEDLTNNGATEEINFMLDVLLCWRSNSLPAEQSPGELHLANAFEQVLQRDAVRYFKVPELFPEPLVDQIKDHIASLSLTTNGDDDEDEDHAEQRRVAARRRVIMSATVGLGSDDLRKLEDFVAVLKMHRSNSITPVEDFITSLPIHWKHSASRGEGLAPDDVVRLIEGPDGMRSFFDDAISIARDFNNRYKEELAVVGKDETA